MVLMAAAEAHAQDPRRRIIVSIPDRKVILLEDGQIKRIYPVAVGKPSTPSPSGEFTVVARISNPTWYYRGKIVGPGSANPIGTRWLGLSVPGYGIHGTSAPASIGKPSSHGCIRMRNADIEELFELVQVGDPVELLSELPADVARFLALPQDERAIVLIAAGN